MARTRSSQLTVTHLRILASIVRLGSDGLPVTVSQLAQEMDYAGPSSLTQTLQIMLRNGYINILGGGEKGRRRIVTLTQRGKIAGGMGGLRVFGHIPAGPLKEVLSQCDLVLNDEELLPHQPGDFLLIVQGDSMVGDGIMPGDKVLLRPDVQVRQGEIAAVHVGNEYEATLKHVYFVPERHQAVLRASNPAYADIVLNEADLHVVGVYRGLVRSI